MKIDIQHLIKPTYMAWSCLIGFILMTILALLFWSGGRADVRATIHEYTYMKDQRELESILSDRDRQIKVTDMYGRIHSVYGKKYHSDYDKAGQYIHQGLKKEVRSEFFRLCYEYSRILSLPYFTLITTAVIETGMNPIARTYKTTIIDGVEVNLILEAGIFQNRYEAVQHALWILHKEMSPSLQQIFSFKFDRMEDLFDPLNALKIEAILFYGAKVRYKADPSWYVTSVHWGSERIWKYYINNVMPPNQFVFNKGTINEDARSPFTYYFYWNAYNSQFERFSTDVFVDESWIVSYKNACSKQEGQFIDMMKYVRTMIEIAEARQDALDEYKKKEDLYQKQWENKLKATDDKYRELVGLLHRGEGKTAKDIFKEGIALFKGLADDIYSEKVDAMRKIMIIILGICSFVILALAVVGAYHIFLKPINRFIHFASLHIGLFINHIIFKVKEFINERKHRKSR